jgi:molecular chaperone GrpE
MTKENSVFQTRSARDGAVMAEQEEEYGVTQAAEAGVITEDEGKVVEIPQADPLAELKAEREHLLDRLARLQAEFDNARKRQEREKQEFRDYATGSVVEQFLPVLDNFALALNATASAEQLRQGVDLIVKQMDEVLRNLSVTAVPTVGQQFDPRVHEALGTVERDDLPDHSIAEEIRKGYKIRERLLRPAMVRVVSNPNQTEA